MALCCDNKTGPEDGEEEDLEDGPLEDRSCTDIIFLVFFAVFLVGMFILFGVGVERGDPHRLLMGTDVAGNVCGRDNSGAGLVGVASSGLDLASTGANRRYLYYDWVRTAKIVADSSLTQVLTSIDLGNFTTLLGLAPSFDSGGGELARDYCVKDAYSGVAQLRRQRGGVFSLETETFEYIKEPVSVSPEMSGFVIGKQLLRNNTAVVAMLQDDGSVKVWRTQKATGAETATHDLLSNNKVKEVLSGGKVCRYCVQECPQDYSPLLNRCVPSSSISSGTGASSISGGIQDFAQSLAQDFQASQNELTMMAFTALALSVLMTVAFRLLAGVIVYAIIGLIVVAVVAGTLALWAVWWLKKGSWEEKQSSNSTGALVTVEQSFTSGLASADTQNEVTGFLVAAIFATIVTVVVLLVLFILRKRIGLVVALFHEAGKAVHAMPFLVLVPLLTFVSLAVTVALWLYGALWIGTAGSPEVDNSTTYVTLVPDPQLYWLRWYHLLGGLWVTQFCIACQHLVIAGSVAGWYFTKDKSSVGMQTMVSAFWRLVRYHLGTAAFGSFIIAMIQLIRIILAYVQHLVERYEKKGFGTASKALLVVLKAVLACLQCVMACFERFMKFINVNAYIETAIYGYNFCRAAMKAFQLLLANAMRVAAINSIGTFVLFLGKLVVVIATGVISYYILRENKEVQHFWPQIVVSVLFAYLISHTFIGVYEMAIDTIFLCFCEDSARNDGINKPYYMSRDLMQFVENSKKALDAMEQRNEMKQNESKHMLVQERRNSDGSIAMVDVD